LPRPSRTARRVPMARSMRLLGWLLAVACLAAVGCDRSAPPAKPRGAVDPQAAVPNAPSTKTQPASGDPEVAVDVRSWEEVRHMIARHRGKVVVVDVWSTWCVPCMREFPGLVRLHRQHGDDVACISVNIDYIGLEDAPPESFRDKVLEFLRKQQATFENVISSDPDEVVLKAVQVSSIPAVLVYDREGVLRKTFTNDDDTYGTGGFTYEEHIIPLVESLVKS